MPHDGTFSGKEDYFSHRGVKLSNAEGGKGLKGKKNWS